MFTDRWEYGQYKEIWVYLRRNFRPNCYAIDANFDGYGDFTCTYIHGTQVYYDHFWIWNEEHSQFEGIPEYDEISAPDLDERTKTIYGFTPSSGGVQDCIRFINGPVAICSVCDGLKFII